MNGPDRHDRRLAWVLVFSLHGLLVFGLWHALRPAGEPAAATAPALVWLRLPPPPQPISATPGLAQPARPTALPEPVRRLAQVLPPIAVAAQAITSPAAPQPAPVAALPQGARASAAAAVSNELLLDTAASRRALRDFAREDSLPLQAVRSGAAPAPRTQAEQLRRGVAQAAVGDCLKGEYFLSGAGLLSLPFFLAAELRGKCRR